MGDLRYIQGIHYFALFIAASEVEIPEADSIMRGQKLRCLIHPPVQPHSPPRLHLPAPLAFSLGCTLDGPEGDVVSKSPVCTAPVNTPRPICQGFPLRTGFDQRAGRIWGGCSPVAANIHRSASSCRGAAWDRASDASGWRVAAYALCLRIDWGGNAKRGRSGLHRDAPTHGGRLYAGERGRLCARTRMPEPVAFSAVRPRLRGRMMQ